MGHNYCTGWCASMRIVPLVASTGLIEGCFRGDVREVLQPLHRNEPQFRRRKGRHKAVEITRDLESVSEGQPHKSSRGARVEQRLFDDRRQRDRENHSRSEEVEAHRKPFVDGVPAPNAHALLVHHRGDLHHLRLLRPEGSHRREPVEDLGHASEYRRARDGLKAPDLPGRCPVDALDAVVEASDEDHGDDGVRRSERDNDYAGDHVRQRIKHSLHLIPQLHINFLKVCAEAVQHGPGRSGIEEGHRRPENSPQR
mmetsp:Transcript_56628/g.77187  ORF Transcript_56628/g.77187 Transcript_56628/m.77187 type:complete len:255 (+) Transcript_56628:864-1628(+)